MVSILALTLLSCSPNLLGEISDREYRGPQGVELRHRRDSRGYTFELVDEAGKRVWLHRSKTSLPNRQPAFSGDGQTVVTEGGAAFELLVLDARGLRSVSVNGTLTEVEKKKSPPYRCGWRWLGPLSREPSDPQTSKVIAIPIRQSGEGDQPETAVTLLFDVATGTLRR